MRLAQYYTEQWICTCISRVCERDRQFRQTKQQQNNWSISFIQLSEQLHMSYIVLTTLAHDYLFYFCAKQAIRIIPFAKAKNKSTHSTWNVPMNAIRCLMMLSFANEKFKFFSSQYLFAHMSSAQLHQERTAGLLREDVPLSVSFIEQILSSNSSSAFAPTAFRVFEEHFQILFFNLSLQSRQPCAKYAIKTLHGMPNYAKTFLLKTTGATPRPHSLVKWTILGFREKVQRYLRARSYDRL